MNHPFWVGLLLSATLNLLAGAAALALGLRAKLAGRAELMIAATMIWNLIVMVPVYALGLTQHLDEAKLGAVSAVWFVLILTVSRGQASWWRFAGEIWRAAAGLARMPWDAVLITVRARSLVVVGPIFTSAVLIWTFGCAYLTPSWKQWDALWYHEPMVGFAIQNHGFAFVDLPWGGAQKINGYPRLCEMTQLWFALFTDRRVVDMVGHVAAPPLALGVYALCRRYTADRVLAIALGCAILLMPAASSLLGSVYVDLHNAAFVVAAAYFITRPDWRLRDALIGVVCLTLAVGSKAMALVPVSILGLVGAARLLGRARSRPLATTGILGLGLVLVGGMAATVYLRNWIHFGNPFWPDLKYDNAAWGIQWPGLVEWGQGEFQRGSHRIDMNLPLSVFLKELYRIPYSTSLASYAQMYEYGTGMIWVVFPLAVAGWLALGVVLVADRIGLLLRHSAWRAVPSAWNLLWLAVTLATMVKFSPALWGARYQIAAAGLASAIVAWVCGRSGLRTLGGGVAAIVTVLGIIAFFWTTPRYWLKPSEALRFMRTPFPEREVSPAREIDPELPLWNGSPVNREVGLARERELGRGAVLVFSEDYGSYMSLFWNNRFSNRIAYVPQNEDFVAAARQLNATWVYCASSDTVCHRRVGAPGSGWVRIGLLDVEGHGSVYRRSR